MKTTIWTPPDSNPELTKAMVRLEEILFEIRKLDLRIKRTQSEINAIVRKRSQLRNNINTLRSNTTSVVSMTEFRNIRLDIARATKAISDQHTFLNYDEERRGEATAAKVAVEREIEALSRTCTILSFKNARSQTEN